MSKEVGKVEKVDTKPSVSFVSCSPNHVLYKHDGCAGKTLQVYVNGRFYGETKILEDPEIIVYSDAIVPSVGASITHKLT